MPKAESPALRLLLACARAHPTTQDEVAIRHLLDEGIDWTLFAQKAVDHGLAELAGRTLARLVPDMVPDEILHALKGLIAQTRSGNQVLLNELSQLIDRLAAGGVQAIPFKGPVLAQQAFGDLSLRRFRDLDILIRDADLSQTIKILGDCGYARDGKLTEPQFLAIHRLQGQEILFKPDASPVEPHTRLTSLKMALDIDYAGLWRRARPDSIFGHTMLTLAPEDTMIVLALHGGKELWWDIKWACDVADFIASYPALDWAQIASRAHAQGCTRMLLVATALARTCLGASVPDFLVAAERRDRVVGEIVGRVLAHWDAEDPGGPPSNKTISMDRLRLHDGFVRQASYVLRTLLLPGPEHIPIVALPGFLEFSYIPIALAHDLVALPLYRAYGRVRAHADRIQDVLALSPLALALRPMSRGVRKRLKVHQQKQVDARRALAANPRDRFAWAKLGDALVGLKRYKRAVSCYDQALLLMPDDKLNWKKRAFAAASTGAKQGETEEPAFDPQSSEGWAFRAGFLATAKQDAEAIRASDSALRLDPNNEAALRIGIQARQNICDWSRREDDKRIARQHVESGIILTPIIFKQVFDSVEDSATLARHWTMKMSATNDPIWRGERYRHDKIRIAYLSTDFRAHAVGHTILGPFERHDKDRFEITAISFGANDKSRSRARIQQAVDHFVDAQSMSDEAVAALMREREIDIAVDLNGLTGHRRTRILARRPAPIQVNYLGYPGTMAVPFMDYLVADHIVIPPESRAFYSEKIAYLPNSYLPSDVTRGTGSKKTPSRQDQGLPESGFVFSCFNSAPKITPEVFDIWMRLLRTVEGSVFWLADREVQTITNLRKQAAARGVSPERLVFARFENSAEDHLARQSLADIFLDTMPYNAHSTGQDALWAGLPILTCPGEDFQSRVAASLLQAVGLPELITTSLRDYEELALALAREPQRLKALREKLARNKSAAPLFDMVSYTRDLEAAYLGMWQRQQSGLPPEDFSVGA